MIVVRMMGGLGNQMFQYAFGRCLAVRRRVELQLDLCWYKDNRTRRFSLDCFPIAATIASTRVTRMLTHGGLRGLAYRLSSGMPPGTWRRAPRTVVEQSLRHDPAHAGDSTNFLHYTGYWQSEKYYLPIADEIRATFHSRHAHGAGYRDWSRMIMSSQSVSIHVRRGDYQNDDSYTRVHGVTDIGYFHAAISFISGQVPDARFFVFSDDPAWCHDRFREVANTLIVDLAGERSDLEQFELMRLCRHHIISNSTFGWWGAWLGCTGASIVIAPRRWFADPTLDAADIVPDRWIRM